MTPMKPETRKALQEESSEYRTRGNALIAHADRIDDLLQNDPLLLPPVATVPIKSAPPPLPPAETEIHRVSRQGLITQVEGAKTALKILGRPATLPEIFDVIQNHGVPAKTSTLDNFRSVMSRSGEFETNGSGQWRIKPRENPFDPRSDDPLKRAGDPNGHAQTDLTTGEQHQNRGVA